MEFLKFFGVFISMYFIVIPANAMEKPESDVFSLLNRPEVKLYLKERESKNDPIITFYLSDGDTKHPNKIARSKLKAIFPPLDDMIKDCANKDESVSIKMHHKSFLIAVAAYYIEHVWGIKIEHADFVEDLGYANEKQNILGELHAFDSNAGEKLLSRNGLLTAPALEQQLTILVNEINEYLTRYKHNNYPSDGSIAQAQSLIFKHLIQLDPGHEGTENLLKALVSKNLALLLPYPKDVTTRIFLAESTRTPEVLLLMRKLYLYIQKFPVATSYYDALFSNPIDANLKFKNDRFCAKNNKFGQPEQLAFEMNNTLDAIIEFLRPLGFKPKFIYESKKYNNTFNISIKLQ